MIPYVISVSYPDYKRPSLYQDFGVVIEEEINTYFLHRICEFILDRTDDRDLESVRDIYHFFENYYNEYYMDNSPWEAMVFINGEWKNITPSDDKIWEHIQLIKLEEQEDMVNEKIEEDKKDKEEVNKEQKEEFELDEDEKILLAKMKEFFEKMLQENPLPPEHIESLKNLTELERLSSLFNIYLTPDNYNKNKYLFQGFLNLCIKFVQKSIEIITKKMETDESEELHKQLSHALAAYSSAVFVKDTFKF